MATQYQPVPDSTGKGRFTGRGRRKRNQWWVNNLATSGTGADALTVVWRWTLSTLKKIEEHEPGRADAARWFLARELARAIATLPEARIDRRAGLTQEEVDYLTDPSAKKYR